MYLCGSLLFYQIKLAEHYTQETKMPQVRQFFGISIRKVSCPDKGQKILITSSRLDLDLDYDLDSI